MQIKSLISRAIYKSHCYFLLLLTLVVHADPGHDTDGDTLFHNQEACNGYFSAGIRTGSCDSADACTEHKKCVVENKHSCQVSEHPGNLTITSPYPSIGSPLCIVIGDSQLCPYCQKTEDFDCDGAPDNSETITDATDPSVPFPEQDVDKDMIGRQCDNCPDTPNWDQLDENNNGIGDACEPPAPPSNLEIN